jgi:hypothetical protein
MPVVKFPTPPPHDCASIARLTSTVVADTVGLVYDRAGPLETETFARVVLHATVTAIAMHLGKDKAQAALMLELTRLFVD